MKNKIGILLATAMLAVLAFPASASQSKLTPAIDIISVVQDQSVTIRNSNLPGNDTINVRMGLSGTLGIGGILVTKLTTGAGGSFLVNFHIPPELQGQQIISIRLESLTVGYPAIYDYFYNNTAVVVPNYSTTPYTVTVVPTWKGPQEGFPGIDILSVVKGGSVTVRLINMPANRNYTVQMSDSRDAFHNKGWLDVSVMGTASGGIFNATFTIPAALQFRPMISIKMINQTTHIWITQSFYNE